MAREVTGINWKYLGDAIPAFLTICIMPFTYSIAYGLIAGIMSYILINMTVFIIEKASGGRLKPAEKDTKDPWSYKIPGGFLPPYLQRIISGKKDFWRDHEVDEGHELEADGKRDSDEAYHGITIDNIEKSNLAQPTPVPAIAHGEKPS